MIFYKFVSTIFWPSYDFHPWQIELAESILFSYVWVSICSSVKRAALRPVACIRVKTYCGLPKTVKVYFFEISVGFVVLLLLVSYIYGSLGWKSIRTDILSPA